MIHQDSKSLKPRILVTGATGYIGGRLVLKLLEAGYRIRTLGRSLDKLKDRPWSNHENVELVEADIYNLSVMIQAAKGCTAGYYMIHSMDAKQKDFREADRIAAENMREAVNQADWKQLIYLGALGSSEDQLSKHLQSRHEVEKILSAGKVPVTILRAAMIIGSGSASFEILRYLVDRLPLMVTPKWVRTPVQPIAIRNVLEYLVRCLEVPETLGQSFDIGGPEVVTYDQLMQIYAQEAGLMRRWCIPVPVLTPRLSSYWIHLFTPLPAWIALPLAEGLKNPVICQNHKIRKLIPQQLLSYQEAFSRALEHTKAHQMATHWTDSGRLPIEWVQSGDPAWSGGTILEDRQHLTIDAPIEGVWKMVVQIGGDHGWYYANWLWQFRGFLDKLIGGVGLWRGRRAPQQLMRGDAVDFWRVSLVEPPQHLHLVAEMRIPGTATLEFHLQDLEDDKTLLKQHARFFPKGLIGLLYWYISSPFHMMIFSGMIQNIARAAVHHFDSTNSGTRSVRPGR